MDTSGARAGSGGASPLSDATDKELVAQFLSGDEDAFAEIAHRYRAKMHSVAYCHLRNHSDAEEIAQDTLIRAHRGLARFRGDSSLATWLHSIAFNLSRNRHMYNYRRRRHDTLSLNCPCGEESQETFGDMIASQAPNPSRSAAVCEFTDAVEGCMDMLVSSQREVLMMRNGLSRSYKEIASELGLKMGTVKSRVARARETLRTHIAEVYPDIDSKATGAGWFETVRAQGCIAIASA